MAVRIFIGYEVNSQSIVNNTSNVTCWVNATWDSGSYNLLEKSGYLTIDGTKYTFTSPFNTERSDSGSTRLFTKTVTITHETDGTKRLPLLASYTSGVSSGTVKASVTVYLSDITRASVLSTPPSSITLGEPVTFTINRQGVSEITERLYYEYNNAAGNLRVIYIIGTSGSTVGNSQTTMTATWTPPLSLAAEIPKSSTMVGKIWHYCFDENRSVIRYRSYPVNLVVPDSLKPTIDSLKVTDVSGHETTYGAWIKGLTKLTFWASGKVSYGSPIKSASITVGNTTYTDRKSASNDTVVDEVVRNVTPTAAGEVVFAARVTDARGHTGTKSITKTVFDYKQPVVEKLTVLRCDFDGTENDQGEYVRVKFTTTATPLNDKNSVKHSLRYKKSADTEYTTVDLESNSFTDGKPNEANTAAALIAANKYAVTDAVYIFPADSGSSYEVAIRLEDDFITETRATSASTAFTLMHWKADGTGMGIGKISEESNLLDIGMPTRFNQPVYGNVMGLNKLPEIPANSDLNDYMATGSYAVYRNDVAETIANIPVKSAGRLEISSTTGEGLRVSEWSYLRQRFIPYVLGHPTWERDIRRSADNIWEYEDWHRTSLSAEASSTLYNAMMPYFSTQPKLLWGGDMENGWYMREDQTATLSEKVSEQRNGIILVFCYYNGANNTNWGWQTAYIPKLLVALEPGGSHSFNLANSRFASVGTKYLYINDGSIAGHSDNEYHSGISGVGAAASGITYDNRKFVLRYVIGV